MSQSIFRIIVSPRHPTFDSSGSRFIQSAQELGLGGLTGCVCARLYFLQGHLSIQDVDRIGRELLADPVVETAASAQLSATESQSQPATPAPAQHTIEVTLLSGVTDPPAENLVRAARGLGITGLARAATGQRFEITGEMTPATLQRLAAGLFANPVVQRFAIDQPITPPFFPYQAADERVDVIPLRAAPAADLEAISTARRLALNLAEMQAIQAYFMAEGRDPTDVELETLAQTWSEHCRHKTFKAIIDYDGPPPGAPTHGGAPTRQRVAGLLDTYIRRATERVNKPWVRSAFVDNAGIIAFTDDYDLAFKVETHNHPSALEPFGGANTGVGGVVRDILGVSARPIANTDVLCFGPPDLPPDSLPAGVLHPRRIAAGVIHGIEDYGNKMGIPTVNGAVVYHEGYTANPLVYCGCLGLLPRGSHRTAVQAGDLIIAIGGRTGRDGLRGATFSSMEMDAATSEIAGTAVQIGHPLQEKQVQEVVLRARDEGLYNAITDCGAGGFSSAVGEMGEHTGARVQLEAVTLKYPGLRPWEIWLSEAQERMVLAVPAANWPRLQQICAGQNVEAICLGEFEPTGRLRLFYGQRLVGDLAMDFLHNGLPQRIMPAFWRPPDNHSQPSAAAIRQTPAETLLALLAHPDIRSKEDIVRRYDHEVQGGTAVKPLAGAANAGPGNAAVLVPQPVQALSLREEKALPGAALGNGLRPGYSRQDPYLMAWAAVDEALRNVVAVGADPDQVAILDNFCWGNPNLPDRLGALVRCVQGCHDAAVAYGAPFISGKDSLNNEYTGADGQKHAIPGTLLVSALGIVPDVRQTVTMDLKDAGNLLYLVGDTRAEMGGGHYALVGGTERSGSAPLPQPVPDALARLRAVHQAIRAGLVQACHDCSEGGLAVTLAEMALAGQPGLVVDIGRLASPVLTATEALFAESLTRFVLEVRPADTAALTRLLADVPHAPLGVVTEAAEFVIQQDGATLIHLPVAALGQAWAGRRIDVHQPSHTGGTLPSPPASPRSVLSRTPKVLILHANGTNRDRDAALACRLAGGQPDIVHVNELLAGERRLADYHMLVIPGGFSYGDDLGAGVLWSLDLRYGLGEQLHRFVDSGRPVLGICNGFQALVKAELLPGHTLGDRDVTLTLNESARFECRWVYLRANLACPNLFTQGLSDLIYCPVAHGEGRVAVRDGGVANLLTAQEDCAAQNLAALHYVDAQGNLAGYPHNPNGSTAGIAGLSNAAGNVLGLMPHPENHIFPWQNPCRHCREGKMMGLRLFENGIKAA